MRVIGLTGSSGTGKSEAARTLADLGAAIIDADVEGHRAYDKGTIGWRRLVEIFSSGILDANGEIDRARLGALVFKDGRAMAWLEASIHPLIRQRVSRAIDAYREAGESVVVVDAALLYHAGWHDLADEVWIMSSPLLEVVRRLQGRGMSIEDIKRRLAVQGPQEPQIARADVVIENTGSTGELADRVRELWEERILTKGVASNGRPD